jgi:putative membrane protein
MGMMGFGLLMMLFGLLVVLGIVALIVWAVLHFSGAGGQGRGPSDRVSAREILDRRYARGEIDREEYQRIRQELG